ncbi:2-succinyl-5-enolpyruvyl-6-hydroxy-3-cyclohexene-1-carboxylic-acid synthase [Kocuria sp. CPCC 205297]|uniref:2-succinyl-5-enolpyruvyl-6-hydroxy-3- cyclohexene-1-carboxylic-acid synthase n=1 Tax=Kocuria sp. CPCC 205297 TaxID=3073558 RepID=UPI0034D49446
MTPTTAPSDLHPGRDARMTDAHVLAGIVVDELVRNGVRCFLYCPGSRNGPLGFELARRSQNRELVLHVQLDERVAGFTALGMAKATGSPVAVVTTSGSAVTNLLPSVTEANYSDVPVIVLSANRPVSVLGTGASQTIEQIEALRSQVRGSMQITPEGADTATVNASIRSTVCRAVLTGGGRLGASAGPVHLDLPLTSALPPRQFEPRLPAGKPDHAPWVTPPATRGSGAAAEPHRVHSHSLVIAGDGANPRLLPAGVPVVAEPTVALREDQTRLHPWVLDYLTPEEVVVLGRPTLHRNVTRTMRHPGIRASFLSDGNERWLYAAADLDAVVTAVAPPETRDEAWDQHVTTLDQTLRAAWATALADSTVQPCGAHAVSAVLATVPESELLWLGASNTIRDAALVAREFPQFTLSNRGTAGIDGTLASAAGVALAHPDRHVTAMVGDLTFLYDATALQFGRYEQVPTNLTLVVINDQGGGIFELLEQGAPEYKQPPYATTFERIYGTPQAVNIAALCQAYQVRHRVADLAELPQALHEEHANGLSVIEVPAARGHLRDLHARARECADARWNAQTTPTSPITTPQGGTRP